MVNSSQWLKDEMQQWTDAMRARGHVPRLDDKGNLDIFVLDVEMSFMGHNGPGCARCDWKCCWHCVGIDEIPKCVKES